MALFEHMPTDLVLVRHGESEGNLYDDLLKKGKELGNADLARELQRKLHGRHSSEWRLTDLGRHQARRAGQVLEAEVLDQGVGFFDRHFCSSYARAMETAAHMDLPGARYRISIFLREKDSVREWRRSGVCGVASIDTRSAGTGAAELSKFYGDAAGLESPADLVMRAHVFLSHLQRQCTGQRVLVVCHNHIMKAFRILLMGVHPSKIEQAWDEVTPNCCIEWYSRRDSSGGIQAHFNRQVVLALRDPKDPEATHCKAARQETHLRTSPNATELSSEDLCQAVRGYPQSLNSQDMALLVARKAAKDQHEVPPAKPAFVSAMTKMSILASGSLKSRLLTGRSAKLKSDNVAAQSVEPTTPPGA